MAATNIRSFRHACIVVQDLALSIRFYVELFGMKLEKLYSVQGTYPEKVFARNGVHLLYAKLRFPSERSGKPASLELHEWIRPKIKRSGSVRGHIAFTVSALDKEFRRLSSHGIKFISKPILSPEGHTKICFCLDPDSNLIELIEDVSPKRFTSGKKKGQ